MISLPLLGLGMPLPPPPQHIVVTPGMPPMPEGMRPPLAAYPTTRIPAARWSCRVTAGDSSYEVRARVGAIEPDPSQVVPRWPPFTIVTVDAGNHQFDGTYLATYTPGQTYGFRLALEGQAYELTLFRSQRIEIKRLSENQWVDVGGGACATAPLQE